MEDHIDPELEKPVEKTKAELFQENPDRFEDLKDCLFVVKRDESGRLMILNQCKDIDESFIVAGYIDDAMSAFRTAVRMRQNQNRVVVPQKNGIINGARNLFRK